MAALSMNLRVADRLAVVVGGGRVAARKAAALLRAGAIVRMIAPEFDADLRAMNDPHLELIERRYRDGDLHGAWLVIVATSDRALNSTICSDARKMRILCSNAGQPSAGDFSLPAALHRGAINVTVDTGGASPTLAKRILEQIDEQLDPNVGAAAQTLALMRSYLGSLGASQRERAEALRELAEVAPKLLGSMTQTQAQEVVDQTLRRRGDPARGFSHETATCASRGSRLALTQTALITSRLAQAGIRSQVVTIATQGDLMPDRPLSSLAENIFVKEIEASLLAGRADYAVHSCKDLPSTLEAGLQLIAVSAREDPRDAFCSERFGAFEALPAGARVGTSSARRHAQLAALRPDLTYVDCRGNVDTRLKKLRAGEFDAIILAMAGLVRLGARAVYTVPFEPHELVPAVGQGALAIEMRAEGGSLAAAVRTAINDQRSEIAIHCERAALAALGGGCNAPIGIHAHWQGDALCVGGIVLSSDGARTVSARVKSRAANTVQASNLGRRLAEQLQASGAAQIARGSSNAGPLCGKLILLPRTQERPSRIALALEQQGARVVQIRSAEEALDALGEGAPDMVVFPSSGSVEAVAPLLAAWHRRQPRPTVAAMGPASAAAAAERGLAADIVAKDASVPSLLAVIQRHFTNDNPTP